MLQQSEDSSPVCVSVQRSVRVGCVEQERPGVSEEETYMRCAFL